jgi:hypothetical protein
MGKDETVGTGTRAHDEQSSTQQDCGGTAGALGEVQGAAEEGGVTLVRSEAKKESGTLSRSLFAELVVLRKHEGQSPDFVRDEPQILAPVVCGPPAVIDFDGEHVLHGLGKRTDVGQADSHLFCEMVKDRAGDAIDPAGAGKGDKDPVLDSLSVRVGRNDFPEEFVRLTLGLVVVCVRHRVYKPSLGV